MRQEQIIAAVARVVIATVREIEAVVMVVRVANLHLWLKRMPLGMSAYCPCSCSGGNSFATDGDTGGTPGSKRGLPLLIPATCPVGTPLA